MKGRFWFYLLALIIVVGLLAFWDWSSNRLQAQAAAQTAHALADSRQDLDAYLFKQTDGPRLVGMAKRIRNNQPEFVRPIVEKAYQLAPTNSDVVLLASAFHPELKTKALELNPLIDQKIDPNSPLGQLR